MAKFITVAGQDAQLDYVAACTEMYFVVGQPATRAAAIAAATTAAIPLTGADFAKSGAGARVLTIAAKSANGSVAGNADHIALCTATELRYATTAPVQAVNVGALVSSAALTVTASAIA